MKNKSDAREKMLKAATTLFQIKGYHATGLNEILAESESPKGSMYYYFPKGKEELAIEAIAMAGTSIQSRIQRTFDQYNTTNEALDALLSDMIVDFQKDSKLQDLSLSLIALETYLTSEKINAKCKEEFDLIEKIFYKKLLEDGYEEKEADELAVMIQIMIEGSITLCVTKDQPELLEIVKKQIHRMLEK